MLVTGNNRLDRSKSNQYTLSIRINSGGFCFFVCDSVTKEVMYQSNFLISGSSASLDLQRFFDTNDFLRYDFSSVVVDINTPDCFFVPKVYFEEDSLEQEALFVLGEKVKRSLPLFTYLDHAELYVVFMFDKEMWDLLCHNLAKPIFRSSVESDYNTVIGRLKDGDDKQSFLFFRDDYITWISVEAGKITLINSFRVTSIEDVVYFAVHISEQISFDRTEDTLYLTNLTHTSVNQVQSNLSKFFNKIESL
ncbi:MAG: DUF3822 family protein [Bacteroidales bacterium]